jgi:hypothetical protein
VKTLEAFVIDSDGWGHADMVEACRLILRTVEVGAKWCQTDVPADCEDWPPDVVAAEVLRQIASRTGRVEGRYDYARTGVIEVAWDEVWSAFVTFAPWAYDATVWNAVSDDIVSLADEGQSVFVRLTPEQYGVIAAELGQASLIRYREWRRVRTERGKRRSCPCCPGAPRGHRSRASAALVVRAEHSRSQQEVVPPTRRGTAMQVSIRRKSGGLRIPTSGLIAVPWMTVGLLQKMRSPRASVGWAWTRRHRCSCTRRCGHSAELTAGLKPSVGPWSEHVGR